jgi:RHS repeat-associated protein
LRRVDRNGRVRAFDYDQDGRVVAEIWCNTVGDADLDRDRQNTITWTYDESGKLLSVVDDYSSYSYAYDSSGRVTTEIVSNAGGPVTVITTEYGTRLDNQPVSRSATVDGTSDFVNLYEYDAQDRLVALRQTGQGGSAVADKLVTFTYNDNGQFVTITRYASLDGTQLVAVSDYTYDQFGRPVSLVHYQDPADPLAGYTWTWEGGGNAVEVVPVGAASGPQFGSGWMFSFGGPFAPAASREVDVNPLPDHVWTFDTALLGRLVQATSTDGTADYQYDSRGQLIGADYTAGAGLPTVPPDEFYAYDANGNRTNPGYVTGDHNRLLSDGTYHYEYDAEGNRTRRTEIATGEITEYTWDHRNRLVRVTTRTTDNGCSENGTGSGTWTSGACPVFGTPLTTVTSYAYDYLNRWIARSHNPDGVPASGTALAAGGFDTHFVYEANQIILQLSATGDVSNRYLWGPAVDQILADEQITDPTAPGNILWPLTDHLNTVRDLAAYDADTDTTTIVNHLIYDAYGRLVAQTDSDYTTLFAFTARPFDETTGLQNNLNRWYDAEVGRWLSEDPIGFRAGDANLYRYVENGPTNATDPSGLDAYDGPWIGAPYDGPWIGASPPVHVQWWNHIRGSVVNWWAPSPEPWRAPYQRNPAAQADFEELATFVRNLPRDVAWLDPCYVWAGEVDVPRRFWPNYQRADKSSITVRQVYWDVKGLAVEGGHTAFEVMFPDGTCIYFDEGGTWSSIAGALGGKDRWFGPDEIPSHYKNQRYSLESLAPPQAP